LQYVLEQPENLESWANRLLGVKQQHDEEAGKFIDAAITDALALSPEIEIEGVWPAKHIANIIETVAGTAFERQREVAAHFYCVKQNSRGIRSVGDGSEEFEMYNKYLDYSRKYKPTHPTMALALEYIAGAFKQDAEEDKKSAITGLH
jgi:hypothetical protein